MWGVETKGGAEIWDTEPVFLGEKVTWRDRIKLVFYPKKWFLYRWVRGYSRVLDVGCGTGASVIDLKKFLGKGVDVTGVDVVKLQVELANEKIKKNGVWAEAVWYDGEHLPFSDASFDAIYTSDVLGHVKNVRGWLAELNRVLKPGGKLAMFAESKPGKHAWIRNYLLKRGLNIDPHEQFHISLYGKNTLREFLDAAGFDVKKMRGIAWAKLLINPEEYYHGLQGCHPERPEGAEGSLYNTSDFAKKRDSSTRHAASVGMTLVLMTSKILYKIKKRLHPYSTALCELYCLIEMLTVGRWVEAQGYVILGRKR